MTQQIQLTRGQVAIVDDWWYEELNKHRWLASWNRGTQSFYAIRSLPRVNGKQSSISMHSIISKSPKGFQTDHINHDTLDNREENLRACTSSQNCMNRKNRSDNISGHKGVSRHGSRWRVRICVGGVRHNIGTFEDKTCAILAYDKYAHKLHGDYAFVDGEDNE